MIGIARSAARASTGSARERPPVIVVGAGPGGLSVSAALRRRRIRAVVLEQAAAPAATWRAGYDRLRLNTSRLTSRLPKAAYERGAGLFPTRDEFVAYLDRYAERERVDIRLGTRVDRIERDGRRWRLRTSTGELDAEDVVVATGYAREPFVPPWPGRDRFERRLLHAAEYRNAEPFRGRDVLVVGCGSSGMEIAHDLSQGGAGRVRLAVRTPPNLVLRAVAGVPGDPLGVMLLKLPPRIADAQMRVVQRLVVGDLSAHGLPPADEGPFARLARTGTAPAVIDREVVDAVRQGRIEVVPGVDALDATGATLTGGGRVEPDVLVAATGYRTGLGPIAGHLGVLDERGVPRVADGRESAPGLRFVGFVPVPGQIRRLGLEARRAARQIARARR